MITENLSTLKIHKLTQEQYNREAANGNLDDNAIYLTPDEEIDLTSYATKEELDGKANISHTHDDKYYTETEIDAKLSAKSDSTHNHTGVYDVNGAAASALLSAQTYTDEAVDALNEIVATKSNTSALTSHTGNTVVHVTEANKTNWNAAKTHADSAHAPTTNATQTASGLMSADDKIKLDGITAGANKYTLPSAGTSLGGVKSGGDVTISSGVITVNDDSHNHIISNIDGLQSALDSKAVNGHNHDEIYYTETEVDSLLEDKANTSHTHTIANITNLQSTLEGKANTSHGTHVTYSSTTPVMDGNASVGTASTVARSDHRHPTDTSRASQESLDSHTGNSTSHITSTERTNWNAAYTHSQTAHAPSEAEPNQNAFSNVKIGDVTIAADIKTDTLTLVAGDNITIAPDATNDKITISAKDSTYNLGSFGITATATELNKLDGVTATTTEINYIDGTTSNIQEQLDNKVPTSRTINGKALSSNITLSASDIGADASGTAQTKADSALASAKAYTDSVKNDLLNGAGSAYDTLKELGDLIDTNVDAIDALEIVAVNKADKGHTHDDRYYTETEINSKISTLNTSISGKANSSHSHAISDVTNLQSTLDSKAASSHTHKYAGSSSAGGAATSANKLAVARTISLTGDITGSTTFDGSGDVSITTVINDDSHNHTIANIDNLQTSLDGKQSTINGGASTITSSNLTANRALISNSSGKVAVSAVTNTELGYLDGVTSNVQTQLDGKSNTGHTHSYAGSSSVGGSATSAVKLDTNTAGDSNTPVYFSGGKPVACTSLDLNTSGSSASCTGNSATATKLQTARTIGLGTGATGTATSFNGTGNITIPVTDVKESYLSWGGKNLVGSVSPIGASLSSEHSANRLAYLNPAAIKVEYSNDAGSTWADSGLGNSAKINFVTTSNGISVGSNATVTTNHRTRVTLTAQDGANGYVYTRPRKMLINVSTAGHGLTVTIEAKTGVSGASWTTLGTYELNGWSGWNDIPMSISTFGGGTNQTGNYWYMRLTFATTSVSSSYTTTKSSIIGLRLFGDTCWTRTSNMGETGHLYSYDASQNATFPASVNAPTFSGSGVATLAEVKSYLGI